MKKAKKEKERKKVENEKERKAEKKVQNDETFLLILPHRVE